MNIDTTPTEQAHKELEQAFLFLNKALFEDKLPECLITLQRHRGIHGLFSPHRFIREGGETVHEISINPQNFAMATLREVLSIVGRQMCHLWAHVNGVQGRRGYHSTGWADQMELIGLMPSSTGKPGGKRTGEKVMHYIVPDGPFFVATSELIATGFNITWLDRVAAPWDMVDEDIKADQGDERQPLAGSLLGKVGLLVNRSNADDDSIPPDLGEVATRGHDSDEVPAGGSSLHDEGGVPQSGQYPGEATSRAAAAEHFGPTSMSTTDHLPHEHEFDGAAPSGDGYADDANSKPVILDTGSKARTGEKPVSVQLISVAGKASNVKKNLDKVKFTCPTCQLNAWSKSSAVLDCGTCKVPMVSQHAIQAEELASEEPSADAESEAA